MRAFDVRKRRPSAKLAAMDKARREFEREVMTQFGIALKKARERRFETAKEFAQAIGVEENRYRHWERGTAKPDIAMITRISRLLEIEVTELFPRAWKPRREGNSAPN